MAIVDRVYVDTSAYLAVLLGERGAAQTLGFLKNKALCSSTLLSIEAERNLIHLVRRRQLSRKLYEEAFHQLRVDTELFVLRDLTPDLCLGRDFPPVRTPRSSDLVHLRTARWFLENGGLLRFTALDDGLLKAAEEFGLPVS
ncbi:MAG: hypothetical protein HYW49_12400 [Deltaproteobacteria bacterium]|nr:hypothetical protein [Deltaproteobacteria bacterium]